METIKTIIYFLYLPYLWVYNSKELFGSGIGSAYGQMIIMFGVVISFTLQFAVIIIIAGIIIAGIFS